MKHKKRQILQALHETMCTVVFVSLIGSSLTVFNTFSVSAALSVLVMLGGMGKSFGLSPVTTTTVMMRAVATKTNPDMTAL